MDKETTQEDIVGSKFGDSEGSRYSLIMTDPSFERRLKAYDPNLKLMFDQFTKRWAILVWREDNTGWQILMKCEDDFGNPMPLDDHIFEHLNWMRKQYDEKHKMGANSFYDNLLSRADDQQEKMRQAQAEENQYRIRSDINQWRKGFNELQGLPKNDAIAGYPKVEYKPKPKGIICPVT